MHRRLINEMKLPEKCGIVRDLSVQASKIPEKWQSRRAMVIGYRSYRCGELIDRARTDLAPGALNRARNTSICHMFSFNNSNKKSTQQC
jgi:hypothetical protein